MKKFLITLFMVAIGVVGCGGQPEKTDNTEQALIYYIIGSQVPVAYAPSPVKIMSWVMQMPSLPRGPQTASSAFYGYWAITNGGSTTTGDLNYLSFYFYRSGTQYYAYAYAWVTDGAGHDILFNNMATVSGYAKDRFFLTWNGNGSSNNLQLTVEDQFYNYRTSNIANFYFARGVAPTIVYSPYVGFGTQDSSHCIQDFPNDNSTFDMQPYYGLGLAGDHFVNMAAPLSQVPCHLTGTNTPTNDHVEWHLTP